MKKHYPILLLTILTIGCQVKIETKTATDQLIATKNQIKNIETQLQLNYETQAAYINLMELETDPGRISKLSSYYQTHKEKQQNLQEQLQQARTQQEQQEAKTPVSNLENQ